MKRGTQYLSTEGAVFEGSYQETALHLLGLSRPLAALTHHCIDACELLEEGDEDANDKLGPAAPLEDGQVGVGGILHGIYSLANVFKLHIDIL